MIFNASRNPHMVAAFRLQSNITTDMITRLATVDQLSSQETKEDSRGIPMVLMGHFTSAELDEPAVSGRVPGETRERESREKKKKKKRKRRVKRSCTLNVRVQRSSAACWRVRSQWGDYTHEARDYRDAQTLAATALQNLRGRAPRNAGELQRRVEGGLVFLRSQISGSNDSGFGMS
ncbi:unnamed protein product [Pleuronectes platessa]|uniref:Uncharacterized protein n=1 Tax=Pleuronectes platessa TaxID=8262 RepID=A0A9N7YL56_PLEPL|nr:unnamed protein product [Pleuronectes platessa]